MRRRKATLLGLLLGIWGLWGTANAQLFSDDFGTGFASISTANWPTACRNGGSSFNTSIGGCAGAGDYEYGINGFGNYITTSGIAIPAAGYELTFDFDFNLGFSFPAIEIRTGGTCGTTLANTFALSNTAGVCTSHSINLDAFAGQTIFIRFRSNTSSATFYFDDVLVDLGSGGGGGTTCLLQDDFGTAFSSISATNWPASCINGASSFNTSAAPCGSTTDRAYGMNGFVYITSMPLAIPSTGFALDLEYSFNQTFSLPTVEVRTGGTCGTTLVQTFTLPNTAGVCTPHSINLDAFAGQTIFLRFRSNSSLQTFYMDDVQVCGNASSAFKIKWADNFNDNNLTLNFAGNDGDEDCASCGPWVLGAGASLNLVPAGGWNGNTNRTEAFPDNQANVYYVRLDRNEYIESPVMDLSNAESFKISFYAKSSSPGTGGGDQWSFSDRLRLQIWDGSAWITIQSLRDDLSATYNGPDDFISAALPFNYYCFSAYKSNSSPGNYYYNSSPNVDPAYFHSGFKFRVIFEGGFSGSPFAWVDDFTFRADNDGYSTMIPCGVSFWNQPLAAAYGQDVGTSGNNNAEKGVELELDNSINIPPTWATEADDGDVVTQVFGLNETERVVFAVLSEQEIDFAFPVVHFNAPSMGWQSSVMSKDNSYSGPGWLYYAVEYISCDLAGGSIAEPTDQFRYYFSFEYGIEFIPVFYHLNTSGIEYGGGVTSLAETFDAPDVISSDNCGANLPYPVLSLSGEWLGDEIQLKWKDPEEPALLSYRVERSRDGSGFEALGTEAIASPMHGLEMQYVDREAPGLAIDSWFYRLRLEYQDGSVQYSNVIRLGRMAPESWWAGIFPNPSAGTARPQVLLPEGGTVRLALVDATGRELLSKNYSLSAGKHTLDALPEDLPAGGYTLVFSGPVGRKHVKWLRLP